MENHKTSRAVVIERPYEANFREIKLTEPMPDAFIAKTTFSSISSGTDMKTYKGQQHPEQCCHPLVPGYENGRRCGKGSQTGSRPFAFPQKRTKT